jgi:hypothetical protein
MVGREFTRREVVRMSVAGAAGAAAGLGLPRAAAGAADADAGWSKTVRELQARVTLTERPPSNGTRSLVPYLELRNVGSTAYPIKVPCGGGHVTFELVDANGTVLRGGWTLPRSGPHADPGTVVLPHDSSMRIGMYCSNWGVPKDAAAMISTDSGAWVLTADEKGKVFLRMTLKAAPTAADPDRTWHGEIVLPPVTVDWAK